MQNKCLKNDTAGKMASQPAALAGGLPQLRAPRPSELPSGGLQTRRNAAAANVRRLLLSFWKDLNHFQETTTFTYFYFFKVTRGEMRKPWAAKARFYWNHFTDKFEIIGYWFHRTELRIYDKSQYVIVKWNVTELSPFFFFWITPDTLLPLAREDNRNCSLSQLQHCSKFNEKKLIYYIEFLLYYKHTREKKNQKVNRTRFYPLTRK